MIEFRRYHRNQYNHLPNSPGVYKFYDDESIIYVGKAKDLRKRVSSYFTKQAELNRKTQKLVSEIKYVEITVVNTEFDSLLLENSLIKENQPKFNILLKDDKSFPSICVTNERFPRIYSTRRIDRSKGQYFGPYTSVKAMNNVLDLLRKLYSIRTCNLVLSEKNISQGKFKVCLEYHLGNCKGPCENLQTEEDYLLDIEQAKAILKGKVSIVKNSYKQLMSQAAASLNYELAQTYKDKMDYLEKFQSKSLIVQAKISNLDVFSIIADNQHAFINYMMIEDGAIRVSETAEVKKNLEEQPSEILAHAILTLREKYQSENAEIITNIDMDQWPDVDIQVPKIGDKRKLIELSLKNAFLAKKEKGSNSKSEVKPPSVLPELQQALRLQQLPDHIECFDNSNIQGTNPVASMVCFKNGKPAKKEYRKYNIKTVTGPDDFASMFEVVGRRYRYLKSESLPLPKLILIDGGKGQLNAAVQALKELQLYGTIPIVGIAKRLEELYVPEDELPLHLSKKSQSLKLLQRIRDEAHRFAITFHKNKRSKGAVKSQLDSIKGIGPKTKDKVIQKYKSIQSIRAANPEELATIIGAEKTRILLDALK